MVESQKPTDAVDDAPRVLGEHPDHTSYTYEEWNGERLDENGEFIYPKNGGYDGVPLEFDNIDDYKKGHGSTVDRIGHPGGTYLGGIPDGGKPASFEARAIDPASLHARYYQYEFTGEGLPEGWKIKAGTAAKWKQMPGGAPQLQFFDEQGREVSIFRLLGAPVKKYTQIPPILRGKIDPIPFDFDN
jgi:hypothetical protein